MDRINFTRRFAVGGIVLASFGFASPALAQSTASSNLSVTATVTANCTLSTSAVAFGSVNTLSGTNVDATGGITVTCTSGTGWTATANAGTGTGASLLTRRMTPATGTTTLNYSLYTTSARTTVWGDGTGTTGTIANSGTGAAQAIPIYGRVPSGQGSVPAGSYSDTVAVTVTY